MRVTPRQPFRYDLTGIVPKIRCTLQCDVVRNDHPFPLLIDSANQAREQSTSQIICVEAFSYCPSLFLLMWIVDPACKMRKGLILGMASGWRVDTNCAWYSCA